MTTTKAYETLLPTELATPEYLEWSNRHFRALLDQFHDPDDNAGRCAREMFNDLWPLIEDYSYEDMDEAREQFAFTIQEFVNGNVGLYELVLKEGE